MSSFKRVHGDYTLDDPLDPELTAYQHHLGTPAADRASEHQSKKRCVEAALPDLNEAPSHSENHEQPSNGSYEDKSASAGLRNVDVVDETHGTDQVHAEGSPASPAQCLTLKSLELFVVNDDDTLFWDFRRHKLISSKIYGESLCQLVLTLSFMSVFTASQQFVDDLHKVVPETLLDDLLDDRKIGYYMWSIKRALVQDCIQSALDNLKSSRIWPPENASFELRQHFWDLYCCLEVLELVFGTHQPSWCSGTWRGIDFRAILSGSEDYRPRKWLRHLITVLMEINWKFDTLNQELPRLTSGKSKDSGSSKSVYNPSEVGVARKSLERETWNDTIRNFQTDVITTWVHAPVEIMEIDCVRNFGALKGSKLSIVKRFKSFAIELRDMPPKSFPPVLAEHFSKFPPGNPDHHHLKVLAVHDDDSGDSRDTSRGARVCTGKFPPPSRGCITPLSELVIHSGGTNHAAAPRTSPKKQNGGPTDTDTHKSVAAVKKLRSKGNATKLRANDGIESRTMAHTKRSPNESEPGDDSDAYPLLAVPGAWDDNWEPEEQSFADISKAAYSWWSRGGREALGNNPENQYGIL